MGRIYDGGAANGGWATSRNGGVTWSHGVLPGITTAGGGPHDRISDTAIAYDAKHHTWLVISLALLGPPVIRGGQPDSERPARRAAQGHSGTLAQARLLARKRPTARLRGFTMEVPAPRPDPPADPPTVGVRAP